MHPAKSFVISLWALLGLLGLLAWPALAQMPLCQEAAPALELARACQDRAVGTLCYGAPEVSITSEQPASSPFAQAGDWIIAPARATIETSAAPDHFGIARLRVPLRAADGIALVDTTFMLVGAARIQDRSTSNRPPYQAIELLTMLSCGSPLPQGLLIQTADDVDESPFLVVNGLTLRLRGTVFLQSAPDPQQPNERTLDIALLEGRTSVFLGGAEAVRLAPSEAVRMRQEGQAEWAVEERAPYSQSLTLLPVYLLGRPFFVAFDASPLITPYDGSGSSPLSRTLVTDPCAVTAGAPVNMRAGAGLEFPVMAVLDTREVVRPIGRAGGSDGDNWWQIAPYLWIKGGLVVTGGNCGAVPPVIPPAPR